MEMPILLTPQALLLAGFVCLIILLMVSKHYTAWGICLFTAAMGLLVASFLPQLSAPAAYWLRIGFVALLLGAVYGAVEGFRLAYWRDRYYNASDDTVTREAPTSLILLLIRRVFRLVTPSL